MVTTTYGRLLYTVIWYVGAHTFRKTYRFISAQSANRTTATRRQKCARHINSYRRIVSSVWLPYR